MDKRKELTWWHTINFPDGYKTKGLHDYDTSAGDRYLFPNVKGKTVLDIGTFDGYWAARAMKEGAKECVSVDMNHRETAVITSEAFGFNYDSSRLQYNMNLPIGFTRFDIVLNYGVVYHLYNPVQGILNSILAANELVLIESAVNQLNGKGFNNLVHDGDDTNYWLPSGEQFKEAIELALRLSGKIGKIELEVSNHDLRATAKIILT
jgi:2-polyprenyl-3-methyl-5-hydroxy-6-metoxy-1,4-benzoquinol methylase